jgi:hypothetical protein
MTPELKKASFGVLLAIVVALLGFTPDAAAGMDKKSTASAKKATQSYKQGHYEEAASIFLQLSLDNPDMPVFVRNLGACYYYLRRPEPALSNLREYMHKKKDLEPDDRAEVERWIAEMDQLRQRGSAPATGPVRGAATVPPPAPAPAAASPPPAAVTTTYAPPTLPLPTLTEPAVRAEPAPPLGSDTVMVQPPTTSGQGHTVAAWILGGVGAAALAGGGVCTYLALSNFSDTEKKYDPGKTSQGKTYAALQWVGYGVGAAAIATAIVLSVVGKDTSGSVVLAPNVGPGMAGAALAGSF